MEPENLFEIERVRDRERKIGYSLHKGTETLVRNRERFEIDCVRDRESQLYCNIQHMIKLVYFDFTKCEICKQIFSVPNILCNT